MRTLARLLFRPGCASLGGLILVTLLTPSLYAQHTDANETTRVEVYTPPGDAKADKETAICPGNVPVGAEPLKITFTAATTSPNPVQYTATFSFSNTTLNGTVKSDTDMVSPPMMDGGMTTFTVSGSIMKADTFRVRVVTTAIAPGPATTDWEVRRAGTPTQQETCEFNVLAPMHTINVNSQPPGVTIDIEVDGESDGTAATPFNRSFPENADVAFTAPDMFDGVPFTEWRNSGVSTDPRYETTVTASETVTAFYGQPAEADIEVVLEDVQGAVSIQDNFIRLPLNRDATFCVRVTNNGPDDAAVVLFGSFDPSVTPVQDVIVEDGPPCDPVSPATFQCHFAVPAGESKKVNIVLRGSLETSTEGGFFGSPTSPVSDPDDSNNGESVVIEVTGEPGIIEGAKRINLGDDVFGPLDGVEIQLLSLQEEVLNTAITSEGGVYQFVVAPGTYIVREEDAPHLSPLDPPGGEITVSVSAAQTVTVNFDNDPDAGLDWGDLPDPRSPSDLLDPSCVQRGGNNQCYPTLLLQGAWHPIREGLHLGATVDPEDNGQPDATAEGDDLDGTDDEDGVTFVSLPPGGTGEVDVVVSLPSDLDEAFLSGYIDFDDNGAFDLPDLVINTFVPAGPQTFTFPIPEDAVLNFARFRLSSRPDNFLGAPVIFPGGAAYDGEVEDYFALLGIDYGDAPDAIDPNRPEIPAGYPTERLDDGARHVATTTIRLGDAIDSDRDGQPTTASDGDDQDNLYDEDGILFEDGFVPVSVRPEPRAPGGLEIRYGIGRGTQGTIIPLASIDGKLDAWMDFNPHDPSGDWDDPGEQVIDSEDVQTGPDFTRLAFTIPADADLGYTFARFRFSRNGNLEFDGLASDGEVEDYLLRILDAHAVINAADSGPGSLRQAIIDAIANAVPAIFDLSGLGKQAAPIQLQSALPPITVPVVIRGGSTILDGSGAGPAAAGLTLAADGSAVSGLTIQGFGGHGLVLESSSNLVQDNNITSNGGDGVRILGTGNTLLGNAISGNGGLGIDGGGDGPTANDDESDGVQNAPVITTSVATDSTRVEGTLTSTPEAAFTVELFSSPACSGSGHGEGATLLGRTTVTTGAGGQAGFAVAFEALLSPGRVVTATATGPLGTSEFSQCVVSTDTEGPDGALPSAFMLHGNYPNPFNPETRLVFDLPEAATVRVEVFDVLGRRALDLPPERMDAGAERSVLLDASRLPSGVYLYRILAQTPARTLMEAGRFMVVK